MSQPLTEQQLDEIDSRTDATRSGPWTLSDDLEGDGYPGHLWVVRTPDSGPDEPDDQAVVISIGDRALGEFIAHARQDVPALLADLRRARDRVAELEAYAYGCDAEGCVLPHSSWCDAAKKTAAANDGCTCGKPWTGHPQPHAMHCWTVNPPRAEVEEMRKRIAELTAENAKLIRWHREDEAALAGMRGTIEYQRAEQAARTAPGATSAENTAPAPTTAPLAASQPSEAPVEGQTAARAATGRVEDPLPEGFTGTQPCGHDDYHSPHEWADRPNLWCPGHSYDDDQAATEEAVR